MNYSYSVGDVIGKGFSSVVYKGINDSTNEPVAIKVKFMLTLGYIKIVLRIFTSYSK